MIERVNFSLQPTILNSKYNSVLTTTTSIVVATEEQMQDQHNSEVSSSTEAVLPGYEVQPDDDGVIHSKEKLNAAFDDLHPLLPEDLVFRTYPCEINGESLAYRCRCAFQIIYDSTNGFEYAMRQKQEPVSLNSNIFPIATQRIQTAMWELMDKVLNKSADQEINDGDNEERFGCIKENLTSVTFASSWYDKADADCIITFHYDHPFDKDEWTRQASLLKDLLRLRHINGRSKKVLVTTPTERGTEGIICDRVRIWQKPNIDDDDHKQWSVEVLSPLDDVTQIKCSENIWYEKPETAFYHPNGNAMQKALAWMLNRLSSIAQDKSLNSDVGCRLLEMYCGCGAHTIALAKTNLLNHITAVEMDPRLVDACRHNIRLNGLEDIVSVTKQDAGKWAKRWSHNKQSDANNAYDILLVDPPRMGLDNQVCEMAKNGPFQHFLYISCGRKALLRDLERLLDVFEVADCAVMDLFPRLDAVETLVHLKRRCDITGFDE